MYDKFGKMNYEELIRAIEGQIAEGDLTTVKEIAEENGLPEEMIMLAAETGEPVSDLLDQTMAAAARLDLEVKEYKGRMPGGPVAEYLKTQCMDIHIAEAVLSKKKSFQECIDRIEKQAKAIVTREKPYLSDQTVFDWAMEYYI